MNRRLEIRISVAAVMIFAGSLWASDESAAFVYQSIAQQERCPACDSTMLAQDCASCEAEARNVGLAMSSMMTPLHGGFSCVATIGIPLHPKCHDCTSPIGTPLHPHASMLVGRFDSAERSCTSCVGSTVSPVQCSPVRMVEQYRNGQLTLVAFPVQ